MTKIKLNILDKKRGRTLNKPLRCLRLQLHGAIYRPDSFVLMLRYCTNLKAIRYESQSLNRIAAYKSHHVIVASDEYAAMITLKCQKQAKRKWLSVSLNFQPR